MSKKRRIPIKETVHVVSNVNIGKVLKLSNNKKWKICNKDKKIKAIIETPHEFETLIQNLYFNIHTIYPPNNPNLRIKGSFIEIEYNATFDTRVHQHPCILELQIQDINKTYPKITTTFTLEHIKTDL